MITGVAAGLGRYTGIDPVVFRVLFAMLVIGSGIGIFLYVAAFLLMKEPNGGPGYVEQWTRRDFTPEAVFALLTGVIGFGLAMNLATVWLGTETLVVGTLLAVALLTAHANGVDLRAVARSLPESLNRRRAPDAPEASEADLGFPYGPDGVYGAHPAQPTWTTIRPAQPAWAPPRTPTPESASHRAPLREESAPETALNETLSDATLSDLSRTDLSRTDVSRQSASPPSYAHAEPFAPHGPFKPLDPYRRSPYDLRPQEFEEKTRPPRVRRRRSFVGVITMMLAIIVGGIVMAAQVGSGSAPDTTVIGGAMLITIGAGLLVAAWWGRGAGLVALGTIVALAIAGGLTFHSGLPSVGSVIWRPVSAAESSRLYEIGIGDATLDLSGLTLAPGSTTSFNASVSVGELKVIVPPTVRVEVHANVKVGDIKIDHSVRGGTDVRVTKVLDPDVAPTGKVSTIVLTLKGGIGDVEVRRAA